MIKHPTTQVKVKRPRATRWKPFHSWLNGKPKGPIVLGLTDAEIEAVSIAMTCIGLALTEHAHQWTPGQKLAFNKATRIMDRRNLKPLADKEYGEIRSKEF